MVSRVTTRNERAVGKHVGEADKKVINQLFGIAAIAISNQCQSGPNSSVEV